MNSPTDLIEKSSGERLRKLSHDLRSPLSILAMGIERLKMMRDDPQQFNMICEMMCQEGIDPLKKLIGNSPTAASVIIAT